MTSTRTWPWPLPDHLTTPGADPQLLGKELLHILDDAIANQPRTLQKRIGPSEVGHPCDRRLGYKLMGAPEVNEHQGVAWKPYIGTCVHAGNEAVIDAWNLANAATFGGEERWLVETTVDVGEIGGTAVTGHADLYDRVTATVVDWKVNGPGMLRGYKRNGPGHQYRAQAHLYGRGFIRAGLPVDTVMIVFLPRNDELHHTHVWHEPYDEQVALDALARAEAISAAGKAVGVGLLDQLATVDAYCSRCPYFKAGSNDLREGCPGDPGSNSNSTPNPPLTLTGMTP